MTTKQKKQQIIIDPSLKTVLLIELAVMEGFEFHKKPVGTAMTVEFTLNGMHFQGLNGGPQFFFNEATSIVVYCDTQEEIDYYWNNLTKDGEEGPCGWLKDKFGVSWQIVPSVLPG